MTEQAAVRVGIRVEGTVQGVGFRPFVYGLAVRGGLHGTVRNDELGVLIEVEGGAATVERFRTALRAEAPRLAVVERVTTYPMAPTGGTGFVITPTDRGGHRRAEVAPDSATCDDCLRELRDPADRRYRYPFINCTGCGPRFTIVRDVPYDRPATTMAGFAMCASCTAEYHDPADRRFHAEPVCCPACGPVLRLLDRAGRDGGHTDPVAAAVALLRAGRIVAVKGLGGYHLAADARSARATAALRARKRREEKPFAVLVADLDTAGRLCRLDPAARLLLTGAARPIVLLERLSSVDSSLAVAPAVAPRSRELGLMLPHTPLHVLLAAGFGGPLVLTSGNVSDEPIAYDDADALDRLARIADAFLVNDRPIHVRTDDSVVRMFRGAPLMIRRSRGYAPAPLRLPIPARRAILGCGAELKSTFCLAEGERAVLSQHIGDLENYATYTSYVRSVAHFQRLYGIVPEVVAHDLHPEYLSGKYAAELADVELVGVQHHHAHIAACLVDNEEPGPVIGVAFDGLGYGTDGTMWGGEFLAADPARAERLGHLATVPMPGGTAAVRQPWRMAAAYLGTAGEGSAVATRNAASWSGVLAVARSAAYSPLTSSAGRLFDAVGALVLGRDTVSFEGQAAVELEQAADRREPGAYRAGLRTGTPFELLGVDLVRAAAADLADGVPAGRISMRLHRGVAVAVADGCELARERTGWSTAALSGGVFQNTLLLGLAVDELAGRGFRVLTHRRVSPNDSGISLGQVAVAATRP